MSSVFDQVTERLIESSFRRPYCPTGRPLSPWSPARRWRWFSAYVFDAYGTLFDVHAAIARYRAAAGIDADRFSEIWRTKQLEYTWTLTLAGHYVGFLDADRARARFCLRARAFGRSQPAPAACSTHISSSMRFPTPAPRSPALKAQGVAPRILSNGTPRMLTAAVEAAVSRRTSMRCCRSTPAPIQAAA